MYSFSASERGRRGIPITWRNIVTDFGATSGGSGTSNGDYAAFSDFREWALEQPAGALGLVLPPTPGSYYGTAGAYGTTVANAPFYGIPKLIVSGYGAAMNGLSGSAVFQSGDTRAAIDSVDPGALSVTLKTEADAAIFDVGRYVLLAGIDLQGFGYPPSSQFFEYCKIASIVGDVVTFTKPIRHRYRDNWPTFWEGSAFETGGYGAATIALVHEGWDCEHWLYGVESYRPGNQTYYFVRKAKLIDVVSDDDGFIIGASEDMKIIGQQHTETHHEVDKLTTRGLITDYGPPSKVINVQSSSVARLTVRRGTRSVIGTARNMYIEGGERAEIRLGPTSYGVSDYIKIKDAIVTTDITAPTMQVDLDENLTYEGDGVFRWSHPSEVPQWLVPGAVGYVLTESPRFAHSFFRVIDTVSDGGGLYDPILIQTTLEGAELPVVTGYANTLLVRQNAPNLTVINSSGCPAAEELSLAPPNSPFGIIKKRTFTLNGNYAVGFLAGRLVHYKINVTQAYTGVASTLNLKIGGPNHVWVVGADMAPVQHSAVRVNLKVAGERIITPGGVTGAQSGDNSLNSLTGGIWMPNTTGHNVFIGNNGSPVDISGEDASVRPIVNIDVLTDQEIAPE